MKDLSADIRMCVVEGGAFVKFSPRALRRVRGKPWVELRNVPTWVRHRLIDRRWREMIQHENVSVEAANTWRETQRARVASFPNVESKTKFHMIRIQKIMRE